MRVLVTGAAGFLGKHVAHRLSEEGCDVTGFDLFRPEGWTGMWTIGDLCVLDQIRSAAKGHDIICHVAGIGDVYLAAEDPPLAAAVNVTGSANVAEAAVANGCRVVYASTWEVYGRPRYEPIDEEHPRAPDHPYSITKLAGESLLLAADRLRDLPVLALRLGTAYGPGLRPNSVFSIFIDRARRGEPIRIQGDGSQSRQFTHASDIARAFVLACHSDLHGVALNTVAREQVSITQLAEMVVSRFATQILYTEARAGDVSSSVVASDRIEELLGWRAAVDFKDGLNELIDAHQPG